MVCPLDYESSEAIRWFDHVFSPPQERLRETEHSENHVVAKTLSHVFCLAAIPPGLEPELREPKTLVLPITLRDKGIEQPYKRRL